jgi:hypothetical protein
VPGATGWLALLGADPWVPNPHGLTQAELVDHLARLYLDTHGATTAPARTVRTEQSLTAFRLAAKVRACRTNRGAQVDGEAGTAYFCRSRVNPGASTNSDKA